MSDSGVRVLDFGDADLGMLYDLDDVGPDGALWIAATGVVEMPASARVSLQNREDPFDLSPLAHLAPDDLWELDLEYSGVQDDDLRHIAHLTGLKRLDLSITAITDAGVSHLEGLRNLERLGLYSCRISRDGVRRLRQALPSCLLTGLPSVTIARQPPPGERSKPAIIEDKICLACGNRTFRSDRIEYGHGEKLVWFQCTNCEQQIGVPYSSVRWVTE